MPEHMPLEPIPETGTIRNVYAEWFEAAQGQAQDELNQLHAEHFLNQRVWEAREALPFDGNPEIHEALEGFYSDHFEMANAVDGCLFEPSELTEVENAKQAKLLQQLIDRSYAAPEGDSVLTLAEKALSHGKHPHETYLQAVRPILSRVRLARLENPADMPLKAAELVLLEKATGVLFAEPGIGITTIGDEEIDRITSLHTRVEDKIEASGIFTAKDKYGGRRLNPKVVDMPHENFYKFSRDTIVDPLHGGPTTNIERARKQFWNEARYAGQLMFHNTPYFESLWRSGGLATRRMQRELHGSMNMHTAERTDGRIHSPTVHFSERYDPMFYKKATQPTDRSGTLAIPIAEIIAAAPYGRDMKYGVMYAKTNELDAAHRQVNVPNNIASVGAGSSDRIGSIGTDRTFYKTGHDVTPDTPVAEAPDGYEFKLDRYMYWVQLGEKEAVDNNYFGIGEHIPQRYFVEKREKLPELARFGSQDDNYAWHKQDDERLSEAINDLQKISIEAYGTNMFVVPLRAGVIEFSVADDIDLPYKPRAQFSLLDK